MTSKDPKAPESLTRRKARPRDLAEVQKPSRKVALNEVLRSLQDLVNNELATSSPTTESAAEPAATRKPRKPPAEKPTARTATEKPIPPGGVQQELLLPDQDEPANTGAAGSTQPETAASDFPESDVVELTLEDLAGEPSRPEDAPPAIDSTPATVAIDTAPEPAAEIPPDLPDTPSTDNLIENDEAPIDLEIESLPDVPEPANVPAPSVAANDASDIPVLEDIIDLHDDGGHPPAGNLPDAGDARRLAIQVAARLNVELRKAGKTGLSSDVITRLARLLGEMLAKAGEIPDNSRPKKPR